MLGSHTYINKRRFVLKIVLAILLVTLVYFAQIEALQIVWCLVLSYVANCSFSIREYIQLTEHVKILTEGFVITVFFVGYVVLTAKPDKSKLESEVNDTDAEV